MAPADHMAWCPIYEQRAAPIDWPARFRAAAEAAHHMGEHDLGGRLSVAARELDGPVPPRVVEAIGRALLGEGS